MIVKKILIFAAYFVPYKGGYVQSILELCKNQQKKGIQIDIVTVNIDKLEEKENIEGINVVRLPGWHLLNGTFPVFKPTFKTYRILKKLRKNNYDLVWTQTRFFSTSLLGMFFAICNKIPYIHTERGAKHSVVLNKLINLLSHLYDHTLGWMVIRFAKYNMGVSQAVCEFLKHLGAKNIEYIPDGIDVFPIAGNKEILKKKWQLHKDDFVITYIGRLIYAKGVQDLIEAVNKIDKPFKLLIAGEGNYRLDLEKLVNQLNLTTKVKFLGELNHDEVMEILQISDVFINPSYSEGLPRSVLEACAMGLPVIATDVGGTKEMIINNKTGILTRPQIISDLVTALNILIRDSSLSKNLGKSAQLYIKENFSWGNVIQKNTILFDKIKV